MQKMFEEVDVAVSRQSLSLLSSGIQNSIISEKLPEIELFYQQYQKNINDGEIDKQQTYSYLNKKSKNNFPNVFLIFRNFVCLF